MVSHHCDRILIRLPSWATYRTSSKKPSGRHLGVGCFVKKGAHARATVSTTTSLKTAFTLRARLDNHRHDRHEACKPIVAFEATVISLDRTRASSATMFRCASIDTNAQRRPVAPAAAGCGQPARREWGRSPPEGPPTRRPPTRPPPASISETKTNYKHGTRINIRPKPDLCAIHLVIQDESRDAACGRSHDS